MSLPRTLAYMSAAVLIALGAGLGQGFVSANISQIAGDLGVTTTEASWLLIAFIVPRSCLPILLIKIRTQYGLRRFTEISTIVYVLADFAAVWMDDLRSAILVEFLSGSASASLSTLAFLYMIEPLSQQWRMRLGLPMALCFLAMGPSFARVISPALIGDGGLLRVHLMALGMALISLVSVYVLPLRPVPHMKVIRPLDLISFALIACGFSAVITGFVMGPLRWWTDAPWLGALLAAGVGAFAVAMVIELHRKEPLLDIRWLASPAMVHLTGALLIFRIILSEQSTGAPRMFQVLGIAPSQLVTLFSVICLFTLLGTLACVAWMKPTRVPQFHFIALILIACGAWMDSQATMDTRPEQMILSQALIAFAGMLFMPPAMISGLISAMKKGPQYILSFIIIYISTQSVGGMIGSGLFTTLVNRRQAFHYQGLMEELATTRPIVAQTLTDQATALAPQITDAALRRAQVVTQMATDASNQAYVMAYNDLYFLTFLLAVLAASALCLHVFRDWLAARIEARRTPTPETSS
ncbi:MFS transporter [Paenirhodobacter populi]|uniref:MFS transporter n=1 Tax=Paenirhodobacter populi TaxID=2306993 RepID=UPI003619DAF3